MSHKLAMPERMKRPLSGRACQFDLDAINIGDKKSEAAIWPSCGLGLSLTEVPFGSHTIVKKICRSKTKNIVDTDADRTRTRRRNLVARSETGLFSLALNALSSPVAVLSDAGHIIEANAAWQKLVAESGRASNRGGRRKYIDVMRSLAADNSEMVHIEAELESIRSGRSREARCCCELEHRKLRLRACRVDVRRGFVIVVSLEDVAKPAAYHSPLDSIEEEHRRTLLQIMRQSIVNRLSSAIAHELNQPLTAILSNAETAISLLDDSQADADQFREILVDVIDDTKRAASVIDCVRKLIRPAERKCESVSVAELIESTVKLLRHAARRAGICIEVEPSVKPYVIHGNFVELQQVLVNLVTNAVEACSTSAFRAGRVVVSATSLRGWVRIAVLDNGPGVPAAFEAGIFEPFATTKSGGLGLGLSICAAIAEMHGGGIAFTNNACSGASAFLTVPAFEGG